MKLTKDTVHTKLKKAQRHVNESLGCEDLTSFQQRRLYYVLGYLNDLVLELEGRREEA